MTDARLRDLERRFRASGSVEEEAAWLRARVQAGELSQERLELAACCGQEAPRLVVKETVDEAALTTRLAQFPDPSLKIIREGTDLRLLVEARRGVAAVHFDWSGQSFAFRHLVTALALTWELWEPAETMGFFSLEPDMTPELAHWLGGQAERWGSDLVNGGNGAAIWVRRAEVVGYLPCSEVPGGVRSLVDHTRSLFLTDSSGERVNSE